MAYNLGDHHFNMHLHIYSSIFHIVLVIFVYHIESVIGIVEYAMYYSGANVVYI